VPKAAAPKAAAPKAAAPKAAPKICKGKTSRDEPCKRVVSTGDYCCKHAPPPLSPGQQFMCGSCAAVVDTPGHCAKCKAALEQLEQDLAPGAAGSAEQQPPAPEQSQAPGAAGSAEQPPAPDEQPQAPGDAASAVQQPPAPDEQSQAPGAEASAVQRLDDSDNDTPPASGELAQAPGDAAAAGKQQQQTTDDDEQPLVATTLWSTFAANIRRTKVDDLRRWCKQWHVDYERCCDGETGDIVDVSGFKSTIVQTMTSRCGEKHMYPPDIYGYGLGYLPHTIEQHTQSTESCTNCKEARRLFGRDDKFCSAHTFGAAFVGQVDFSEYP
jgi:hypothetical protein